LRKIMMALVSVSVFLSVEMASADTLGKQLGSETGFEIPRFVTMRAQKANVRRGPSLDHQVDWIFERPGLPVVVTGEFGHWRQIKDPDGDQGWVHRALISGAKRGMIQVEETPVRNSQVATSDIIGVALKGVIVRLGECGSGLCEITWKNVTGWVKEDSLWGVTPPEASR
jgi:SH3-like domain-containing protein